MAFLPDTYAEVNGVARTSRRLVAFARAHGRPLLCVHAGRQRRTQVDLNGGEIELPRSRASVPLEPDLSYDPFHWRHARAIARTVEAFCPDLVHVTGPNDVGQLGAWLAWRLRVPLVASWHTNVHEFAAERLQRLARVLPRRARRRALAGVERGVLLATARFYRLARVVLAPNPVLVTELQALTGRPVRLMRRGVDADRFSPAYRRRDPGDNAFVIGYVGRLSPEKNVRALAALDEALRGACDRPYRFLVVGDGRERSWLEQRLVHAEFTGMLHGEALSRAFADMDVFYFPSETDTFGNVVLEALASGTPAIVTPHGGPPTIVGDGVTGIVADGTAAVRDAVLGLVRDRERHARMRAAARAAALRASWDAVFETVYDAYREALARPHDRAMPQGASPVSGARG